MTRVQEVLMWCLALAAIGETTRELSATPEKGVRPVAWQQRQMDAPRPMSEDSLATLGSQVTDRDLFRISRRESGVAYDGRTGAQATGLPLLPQSMIPPTPKVPLLLRAIIGGPPWQAVIDGFPGHAEGMIVKGGDRVDRFSIRSIVRDSVIIQAPDTTYRLTLRNE
jgi:hypothetical protein